jgi:hypothetical protein
VLAAMVMLGHVFLWRCIAAKGCAARLAGTQVYPGTMLFYAFFANIFIAYFYLGHLLQVGAKFLFHAISGINLLLLNIGNCCICFYLLFYNAIKANVA